jgi:hypothetical protein
MTLVHRKQFRYLARGIGLSQELHLQAMRDTEEKQNCKLVSL